MTEYSKISSCIKLRTPKLQIIEKITCWTSVNRGVKECHIRFFVKISRYYKLIQSIGENTSHIIWTNSGTIRLTGDAFMDSPRELELLIKIGTVKELHKQGLITNIQLEEVILLITKKHWEVKSHEKSSRLLSSID